MGYGTLGFRSEDELFALTWLEFWDMSDALAWWSRVTNGVPEPKTQAEIDEERAWVLSEDW